MTDRDLAIARAALEAAAKICNREHRRGDLTADYSYAAGMCEHYISDLDPAAIVAGVGEDAEIARLRGIIDADDERLKQAALRVWGEHIWGCDTPDMMAEKIEFLRARVAELEQDAARYRWLREESVRVDPLASVTIKRNHDRNEWNWVNVVTLDAAIDAAMREGEE